MQGINHNLSNEMSILHVNKVDDSSRSNTPFKLRREMAARKNEAEALEKQAREDLLLKQHKEAIEACACQAVESVVMEIVESAPAMSGMVSTFPIFDRIPLCKDLALDKKTTEVLINKVTERYGNEFEIKYDGLRWVEDYALRASHWLSWKIKRDR